MFTTHGYSEVFAQWLNEKGIQASEVKTRFEGELGEMAEGKTEEVQQEVGGS